MIRVAHKHCRRGSFLDQSHFFIPSGPFDSSGVIKILDSEEPIPFLLAFALSSCLNPENWSRRSGAAPAAVISGVPYRSQCGNHLGAADLQGQQGRAQSSNLHSDIPGGMWSHREFTWFSSKTNLPASVNARRLRLNALELSCGRSVCPQFRSPGPGCVRKKRDRRDENTLEKNPVTMEFNSAFSGMLNPSASRSSRRHPISHESERRLP
jgi:hypothetical protein